MNFEKRIKDYITLNAASKLVFGKATTFYSNYNSENGWKPLEVIKINSSSYFKLDDFKNLLFSLGNDYLVTRDDLRKALKIPREYSHDKLADAFYSIFINATRVGGEKRRYMFLSEANEILERNGYRKVTLEEITNKGHSNGNED